MPPTPFLSRYFVNWLASQTMARAEKIVTDEVKARFEKGDLGSYDGILFKDAFRSGRKDGEIGSPVDLGVVGAKEQELVGLLDKMKNLKVTKGNSFKYSLGSWKGLRIAVVETGSGLDRARKGTDALLQIFRPERVVSMGFARSLAPSLTPGALLVPNRLIKDDGSVIDLTPKALEAPKNEGKKDNCPLEENDSAQVDQIRNDEFDAQRECEQDEEQKVESDSDNSEELRNTTAANVFAPDFLRLFASGALVSVEEENVSNLEKTRLARELGACAFDRETWAVADVCVKSGVPFLPLRVVYDASAQAGCKEAARAVKNSGVSAARTLGAFFGAVAKRPSSALDVYKLKEQALEAADKLAKALAVILNASAGIS